MAKILAIAGVVLKETGVNRIKCMENQGFKIVGHTLNGAEPPAPLSPVKILVLVL